MTSTYDCEGENSSLCGACGVDVLFASTRKILGRHEIDRGNVTLPLARAAVAERQFLWTSNFLLARREPLRCLAHRAALPPKINFGKT